MPSHVSTTTEPLGTMEARHAAGIRPEDDYTRVIHELKAMMEEAREEGVNLAEFFQRLQAAGFALVCMVLSLPFLQPLPLGPFGTVAGISLLALGWQMYRGRETPIMPKRLLHASFRGKLLAAPLAFSIRILAFCRKFTRPRLRHLVTGRRGRRLCGALIATSGLLMCAPFIAIPFNNMLPALVAFFACLAELEGDGAMIYVAIGWIVASLAFFAAIILALVFMGAEAWQMTGLPWP